MSRPAASRISSKGQSSAAKARLIIPKRTAGARRQNISAEQESTANVAGLLKRVLHLFRDALDVTLRPYGVTAAQLHVLAMLGREPGLSGAKLARLCTVTPQTMQALIATVEANGWIRRKHHPENERILLATLTPDGEDVLAHCRHAVQAIQKRMLHDLPASDVAMLRSLLERCVSNLGPKDRGRH